MAGRRLEILMAFVAAAREGSFAGAGRTLGRSRDQISKQVAALEAELGVRLFRRTTRALQLTPFGATYLDRIEPLLKQLDEAALAIHAPDQVSGALQVSAPASFATRVLVPALPGFLERHPGLDVRLRLDDRVTPPAEGVDVWVRIAERMDTEYAVESVGTVGRALYASQTYLASHPAPEHPDDLGRHQCLRYAATPNPALWVLSDGVRTERVTVSGRLSADLGLALEAAVRAGAGIAVLPDFVAAPGIRDGTVRRVLPGWAIPALTVFALVPPTSYNSPKTRAFCDFLKEATARRMR